MKKIILFTVFFVFLMIKSVSAADCGGSTTCQCGDTLTSSYNMTSDLTNSTGGSICPGYGIIIGANSTTLNCQGHKLTGNNTGFGIYLNGVSGNVIKNCIVTNFSDGIYLQYSPNNNIINNTANLNQQVGIYLYSSSNTIINNTANLNGHGIVVDYSSNNILTGNTANSNRDIGIYLYSSSSNNSLTSNTLKSNGIDGIEVTQYSNNNNIINNTANSNGRDGIGVWFSSSNNNIINNTANLNGYGIFLGGSPNNIFINNTANSNGYGIYLLWDSSSNNITNNTVNSNQQYGILLAESSINNTIYNNYFNNSVNAWDNETNFWNNSNVGNYWSDFATNPLCIPNSWYNIPGYGNGIDYHPLNTEPCQVITTTTTTTTSSTTTTSTTSSTTTTSSSSTTSTSTSTTSTTTTIKSGGGGCPILKIYDNNKLVTIGKLNLHAPKDQDTSVTSKFTMDSVNGKYEIILDEAAYLFWDGSHINSVQLVDETGKECKLISATHSKYGDVLSAIEKSDDVRVRSYPGDRIKLVYDGCSGNTFTFSIEGYNRKCAICWPW